MKIKINTTSNSSISSFVVMKKNSGKTSEEIYAENWLALKEYDDEEYADYEIENFQEHLIVMIESAEYGAEDDVENIVEKLTERFDPSGEYVLEWMDL